MRRSLNAILLIGLAHLLLHLEASGQTSRRAGFRPSAFAIEHARITAAPGEVVVDGTIVIREGLIEAVGSAAEVRIPLDAERIDGANLVVYPGFVDAFWSGGLEEVTRSQTGAGRNVNYSSYSLGATPPDNRSGLTPEFHAARAVALSDQDRSARHKAGITSALIAPSGGIMSGQAAWVSLSGLPRREIIIASPVAQNLSFRRGSRGYPSTLMGQIAHLRQAFSDAEQYLRRKQSYARQGGPRPPFDPTLDALANSHSQSMPVLWEANSREQIHRALDLAEEFDLKPIIRGGQEAWELAERLAELKVPVVLSLDFAAEPKAVTKANDKHLPVSPRLLAERKRLWQETIDGAAKLVEAGVPLCFTTSGLSKPEELLEKVRLLIDAGLKPQDALRALTTEPARLFGSDQLGRLQRGKLAHLAVFDGDLAEKESKIRFLFCDGIKFEFNKPADAEADSDEKSESKTDEPESAKPGSDEDVSRSDTKSKQAGKPKDHEPDVQDESPSAVSPAEPFSSEIDADRKPSFQTGGNVVIRNARILPVTAEALNGSILIQEGKITELGATVNSPEGIRVIDATGLTVIPGIIDTHSHIAASGGVNESSLAIVPEVRIRDVINGDDLRIFRALAGGVTTIRQLHGSSNPIGGQDAVIKLLWGKPGREMLLRDAPRGVKFALGENPKRSTARYPDTRLGVEAVIRRAFEEGRAYRQQWNRFARQRSSGENVVEPRRDLRLEALAEITEGELRIHCHCYRADEILMLLRLAGWYGIRIQSLQHVLEGYKVAAEIAAHGASCSSFADWWAYKVEVYDAIPHNASLLTEAGASVTLKSDDSELMRHLYQDAAKALRYGGMTERQALSLITINAARQLGLENRMGSIEVGKDADLALFAGHPLNGYARCVMTLVNGEVYFEERSDVPRHDHPSPIPKQPLRETAVTIPETASRRYALTNARIVPVVGETLERGTVVVADGKVAAIAGPDYISPKDASVIDLNGLSVYPGMIHAGGYLALTEIGSLSETHDYRERGDYNPDLRASIAIHPDSELIPVTRANGVLSALSHPTGGTLAGQSVLINLAGWIPPEMAIVDPVALHVYFPRGSRFAPGDKRGEQRSKETSERIDELKEQFRMALRYQKLKAEANKQPKLAPPVPDPKLEALIPYANADGLVIIHANNHGDILAAIAFAEDLKLRWVLSGAAEAWKCADQLKAHNVPTILGPSMQSPTSSDAPFDAPYRNAAILHDAGVRFALKSDFGGANATASARNLPFQSAMAIAYGLPPAEGLKAVTLYPAQILGVADRLGSIEVGKIANLVICDGEMLQPATQVKAVFLAGKPYPATSRHTRLYDRYRRRLEEVRSGRALLGLPDSAEGTP